MGGRRAERGKVRGSFFQVGGRRYQATTAGRRVEGGEGEKSGKVFSRLEGGGRKVESDKKRRKNFPLGTPNNLGNVDA